jgi:hypothetical protein
MQHPRDVDQALSIVPENIEAIPPLKVRSAHVIDVVIPIQEPDLRFDGNHIE